MEQTTKRLEMTDILSDLLKKLKEDEIEPAIYFTTGELGPKYNVMNLGIKEKIAVKILASLSGISLTKANNRFKEIGDIGDLYQEMVTKGVQTTVDDFFGEEIEIININLVDLWDKFSRISKIEGNKAEIQKENVISDIIKDMEPRERKYLMRIVVGKTRLGVKDSTFLDATAKILNQKYVLTSEDNLEKWFDAVESSNINNFLELLDRAYFVTSNLGLVIKTAIFDEISKIEEISKPKIGVPIQNMTAQRASTASEIMERMDERKCLVETKFDGYRLQLHFDDNKVYLWSRSQESYNLQFPDVIESAKQVFSGHTVIAEGELVAFNYDTDQILNFQILTNRRRKYGIEEAIEKISVKVFLFDLLYLDGESLIDKPLRERREKLEKIVKKNRTITVADYNICETEEEIEDLLLQAKNEQSEGIMIKNISKNSIYEPGKRSFYWMKYKADYIEGLLDTFDLVIVGGWAGKGKRSGTWGTVLMAAWDPNDLTYKTFCRLGAGFSDDDLKKITKEMNSNKLKEKPNNVLCNLKPDIWVDPTILIEVSGAEISDSPIHTVPSINNSTNLAIRFPRFTGRYRDDKAIPDGITTVEEIQKISESLIIGTKPISPIQGPIKGENTKPEIKIIPKIENFILSTISNLGKKGRKQIRKEALYSDLIKNDKDINIKLDEFIKILDGLSSKSALFKTTHKLVKF